MYPIFTIEECLCVCIHVYLNYASDSLDFDDGGGFVVDVGLHRFLIFNFMNFC